MEETQRSFEEYLAEEVRRYDGVAVPVRSSLLRRALVRHLPPRRLHPNPADEFCNPKIGPNESIVARYKQLIVAKRRQMDCGEYAEPVIIERIRPDGYMILNGHHRWAAAVQYKEPDMRVSLVNLTHEMDVRQMLSNSRHEKRASLDLEEAVFPMTPDEPAEKPPCNRHTISGLQRFPCLIVDGDGVLSALELDLHGSVGNRMRMRCTLPHNPLSFQADS